MILHVKIAKVMILSYLLHCFLIFQVTHNENKLLAVAFFSVRQPARRQKKAGGQQPYVCALHEQERTHCESSFLVANMQIKIELQTVCAK